MTPGPAGYRALPTRGWSPIGNTVDPSSQARTTDAVLARDLVGERDYARVNYVRESKAFTEVSRNP